MKELQVRSRILAGHSAGPSSASCGSRSSHTDSERQDDEACHWIQFCRAVGRMDVLEMEARRMVQR